jgi:hypothetical protein
VHTSATHPTQQPFAREVPSPMIGSPSVPAHLLAAPARSFPSVLLDYVPAAVVAVVLLAFAVTLVVVAAHQRRDVE